MLYVHILTKIIESSFLQFKAKCYVDKK